jgi:stage II sporulation protein D
VNIKKKLIIMGICIVIVIAVLAANVIRKFQSDDGKNDGRDEEVKENVITIGEAYRLLSYLEYDKGDRESLKLEIVYTDDGMSGWYDRYVNAVYKMGLIEKTIETSPGKALTMGQCKTLIDRLITKNPLFQDVYASLSFDFINADADMTIPQFLELYNAVLDLIPYDERPVREEVLFILDREITEDGRDRIVAGNARYYYERAADYIKFYSDSYEKPAAALSGEEFLTRFVNKGIEALTCDSEIVYISGIYDGSITLHNVWIKEGKGSKVDAFINGIHKELKTQFKLSKDIEQVVGNITIENERITAISVKPDIIRGKVLMTGDDFIEIEGYGRIPLEENYRIYKLYGELAMERTNSILVGYDVTAFVVSGGKISAALIKESIKAENIRVLINTTGYKSIYHEKVELGGTSGFTVKAGDAETVYSADETLTVTPQDEILSEGRVIIEPVSEDGKIILLSVERSAGVPKYRGRIEIIRDNNGLIVVNELPLEEYLYAVIPSEMPTYYGLEPLKAQAVCARSYAYRHLLANSLSEYGAHVDDSVAYQVYNNIEENEDSILAVKDTYGKVVEYNGEVITAYYFSTSCGHTTSIEHVWANGTAVPYLSGRLLGVEEDSKDVLSGGGKGSLSVDLTKEENFRDFILNQSYDTYEKEFNWYRWYVTIDADDIKSNIDKKLSERYKANPELVKTLVSGSPLSSDAVYESIPVDTVGDIVDIFVKTRGTGGIAYELVIRGTERTIKVQTEYNIRVLLSPSNAVVYRQDGSGVDGLSLLPSAFFFIDYNIENDKLKSISISGGGYGHGVGMSQNGAKALADAGKRYEDIIKYFYRGTRLGFIYE